MPVATKELYDRAGQVDQAAMKSWGGVAFGGPGSGPRPGLSEKQHAALVPVDFAAKAAETGKDESKVAADVRRATMRALNSTETGKEFVKTIDTWMSGTVGVAALQDAVAAGGTEPGAHAVLGALRASGDAPPLYRGFGMEGSPAELVERFTPGSTHDINISSFSGNQATGENFAGIGSRWDRDGKVITDTHSPVLFVTEAGGHGIPIVNLAGGGNMNRDYWRGQDEYLAGGRYEVVSAEIADVGGGRDGVLVNLREMMPV